MLFREMITYFHVEINLQLFGNGGSLELSHDLFTHFDILEHHL